MLSKIIFPVLFILIINTCTVAQNSTQQLGFQHVNEKNGLSNNIVNCIAKDSKGFMWIATFDGLNRFDGTHFITFRNNRKDTNSIDDNTVHGICVDANDDIWLATQSGISCYRQATGKFENFKPQENTKGIVFSDIVIDGWGTIWCTGNGGLYEYIPQSKRFRHYSDDNNSPVQLSSHAVHKRGVTLSPDKKSLWLATAKGINHLDIASKKIYNYKQNPAQLKVFDSLEHYPIAFDKKGLLLFGLESPEAQFLQFDLSTNTITPLEILNSQHLSFKSPANRIFADADNNYWISTWGYTLFKYDTEKKISEEFFHSDASALSVNGDFFWDAYQDEEGTIWLGTVNGLSCTNPKLNSYRLHHPFADMTNEKTHYAISRFCEAPNNRWWITCIGKSSLFQYDPVTGFTASFPWNPPGAAKNKEVNFKDLAIFKNYLIINSNAGIYSFDLQKNQFDDLPIKKLKIFIADQSVYSLRIVGDSVCYLYTEKSGIVFYSFQSGVIKSVSTDLLVPNQSWYANNTLSADGSWYLLFGSLELLHYNPGKNSLKKLSIALTDKITLAGADAMSLKEDEDKNLWLSVKGVGLIFYESKTGKTKLWQQTEGLIYNFVFASAIDNAGKIWTAGYNKFSVYDPNKKFFKNFTVPVSENIYSYTNRFINLKNGKFVSNADKFLIEWDPVKLVSKPATQPVLISSFNLNEGPRVLYDQNKSVRLKHYQNNFTIQFGILTGIEKSQYRLQYMLEGFNDNWINADAFNSATYTNVPEKDLVFKVRAIATDGSWQGKETFLEIKVVPPVYRTIWFRILMALLLASVIVWLVRIRINNIRRAEKQKNDFSKMINEWRLKALRSQMNPHFIFNCMNSIDLYILKNDAENASRYLNKFAKLVRLILSQSNDMYVPLGKEIEMLKYYIELEVLRFDYPFSYKIEIDESIDVNDTEVPSMLLQPYVENAILHGLRHKAEPGSLRIKLTRSDDLLFCTIEDDGVGRKKSAVINASRTSQHESKGTILAEERLKVMDNRKGKPIITIIDLIDPNGKATGTKVEINIPVDFDY